jgi:hypothetical protein
MISRASLRLGCFLKELTVVLRDSDSWTKVAESILAIRRHSADPRGRRSAVSERLSETMDDPW